MKTKFYRASLLLLCSIWIISAVSAQQAYRIPFDFATISEAVQEAGGGDTLYIFDGVYTDSVQIHNKHLIIVGDGKPQFAPGSNATSFDIRDSEVEFWYLPFTDFEDDTPPPNFGINAYASDITIKHCIFHRLFSPISLMEGQLEVSHSQFIETRGSHAITLNLGTFLLYNNLIARGEYQGISINRSHGDIFNNTVVGASSNQHFGIIINADAPSAIFNNIIANFGIGVLLSAADSSQLNALEIDHNNVYLTAAPYWYEYNESLDLPIYSGSFEPEPGTGEISEPVSFVDVLAGDYHMEEGSAGIDEGRTGFPLEVNTDLEGAPRLSGSAPDMGAYEWQQTLSVENNLEAPNIELFPQPARSVINMILEEPSAGKALWFDLNGRCIKEISFGHAKKLQLNLPVSAGTYVLQLELPLQTIRRKVIVY